MCVACALAAVLPPASGTPPEVFPQTPDPWPLPRVGVSLTWTGVAGFVLEAEGVRIAFDPFVTRPGLFATLFRRAASDRDLVARHLPPLDAVFVGHTHFDHALDLESIAALSPACRFHGGGTAVELGRRRGIAPARLVEAKDGEVVEVGPFRVEPIRSAHGLVPVVRFVDRATLPATGVPRTPFRWPMGEPLAFRVDVRGRSFHVQGSAGLVDASLARLRPTDVLVACLAARRGNPPLPRAPRGASRPEGADALPPRRLLPSPRRAAAPDRHAPLARVPRRGAGARPRARDGARAADAPRTGRGVTRA